MRLMNKTAIVTGAAGAIGLATARRFVAEGARVALVDREAGAVETAAAQMGGATLAIAADVTREGDVARYVAETVARFGAIDVFFNNAGIAGRVAPLDALAVADFEAVMAVNVTGAFLGLKHALPAMAEGGSVIVTSSVAGLRGALSLGAYVASKHAVMGLVKTAAMEAAPRRVRVNSINPGPVEGPMMRGLESGRTPADPDAAKGAIAKAMRLGRYMEPGEIADLVVFLASDESRMITGSAHVIDAGLTL